MKKVLVVLALTVLSQQSFAAFNCHSADGEIQVSTIEKGTESDVIVTNGSHKFLSSGPFTQHDEPLYSVFEYPHADLKIVRQTLTNHGCRTRACFNGVTTVITKGKLSGTDLYCE